ncbi:hypothetical protein L2719_02665 [Shewanella schlegeliana]|uniref:Uncharacterized protein n=1 Tax=Shewanella schlegeliana TaxID=190308 RepID=A0ABS1SZY4_9GAMM|nr:AhpA/YtjB family protein [Shewanella schlegeliana]MBL4913580.1 hypothetical protein [Shewanella schlegeliana]MCL1108471.1 hypothetical protein [Shewanella schlegeliana]GIU28532.1 membrane protein [Shewanella schlegeliana]
MFYLKGLKKSHRISRLLQIIIAIALFIGLDQLWETSLLQGQQLLKSQTEKMARLLVQQTAYGAAPALQLENDEQLQWLAQALVLDPKVMSASIFSEDGVRLSFAQSVIDEELEPDSEELASILEQYPPYVEAVSQDGKNLGYVEVRLEPKYFFNEIKEAHHINMEQQQIMLLIAGLIGMLLSRALSFKRADFDRRKARVKLRRLLAKKAEKAAAKAAKKQANDAKKQAKKVSSDDMGNAKSAHDVATLPPEAGQVESESTTPKSTESAVAVVETKAKPATNIVPKTESETVTHIESMTETQVRPEVKAKPEITVKPKTAVKPKATTKSKVTVKTASKPKAATKAGSESKTKAKATPKAESKTKPKPKPKPKAQPKPAPKTTPDSDSDSASESESD